MKKKNCLLACLITGFGLYACSSDDPIIEQTPLKPAESLVFVASYVEDSESSKTTGEEWNIWDHGDAIRMSYIQDNETDINFSSRMFYYSTAEAGTAVSLSSTTPITLDFVSNGASSINIFAYSANRFDLFDETDYNENYVIDLNKTSKAGVITNPLYAFKPDITETYVDSVIPMSFWHLLSSVRVKFTGETDPDIYEDMNIYVTGLYSQVSHQWKFDSSTFEPYIETAIPGGSSASAVRDTVWFQDRTANSYAYQYEAEFVPQLNDFDGDDPFTMHFVSADGSKHYSHSLNVDFLPGHKYTMTVGFPEESETPSFDISVVPFDEWLISAGASPNHVYRDDNGDKYINFDKHPSLGGNTFDISVVPFDEWLISAGASVDHVYRDENNDKYINFNKK